MKLRQNRGMNTHNALTRLTQFRQAVYQHFDLRADTLMDLVKVIQFSVPGGLKPLQPVQSQPMLAQVSRCRATLRSLQRLAVARCEN